MLDSVARQPTAFRDKGGAVGDSDKDQRGVNFVTRQKIAGRLNASVAGLDGLMLRRKVRADQNVNVAEISGYLRHDLFPCVASLAGELLSTERICESRAERQAETNPAAIQGTAAGRGISDSPIIPR